jgi:hypothetical protein
MLEDIFSIIGYKHKKSIEIGGRDGIRCHTGVLIREHEFKGLIFDKSEMYVQIGINYYKCHKILDRITFVNGKVTCANIIETLQQMPEFIGDIDIFAIDINGIDYWILREIMLASIISPRIILIRFQSIIDYNLALTVPYYEDFHRNQYDCWHGPNFTGASLRAYISLLRDYVLISINSNVATFLLQKEIILTQEIEEITDISQYYKNDKYRFQRTKHMNWISLE